MNVNECSMKMVAANHERLRVAYRSSLFILGCCYMAVSAFHINNHGIQCKRRGLSTPSSSSSILYLSPSQLFFRRRNHSHNHSHSHKIDKFNNHAYSPIQASVSSVSSSSLSSSSNYYSSFASQTLEFELKNSIASIPAELWNSCLPAPGAFQGDDESNNSNNSNCNVDSLSSLSSTPNSTTKTTMPPSSSSSSSSPFLEHTWLKCLEESGCASPSTGWMPCHVEIKRNSVVCAYIPLYIKNHSMGEFIFDSEWAQYAMKLNIDYYPKLLVGIPFTPVECAKILITPGFKYHLRNLSSSSWIETDVGSGGGSGGGGGGGRGGDNTNANANANTNTVIANNDNESNGEREFRILVAKFLKSIATANNLSSIHMNFITDEEALDISGPLSRPQCLDEEKEQQQHLKDGSAATTTSTSTSTSTTNNSKKEDIASTLGQGVKSVMNRFKQRDNGYIRRTNLQYHWKNCNKNNDGLPYTSFDEYLGCFKSKKRITIRRERRKVIEDQNVRVDAIVGRDILSYPGLVERMFELYTSTIDKMLFGNQYLTLEFFQRLVASDFVDNLLFMCVRYDDATNQKLKAEDVFAGTFNVVKNKVFYGRYWGCLPNFDVKNLHFEVCYWSAIEYCIKHKYERFEPGAGGGDYKWARGFDPVLIHSAHHITQSSFRNAIRDYVKFDSERNIAISELLIEQRSMSAGGKKN